MLCGAVATKAWPMVAFFFAEDVFGGQFCIKDSKVYTFDPETGSLGYLADDIEG